MEAVERVLEADLGCSDVLRLVASMRKASNGLTAKPMENHIRHRVASPDRESDAEHATCGTMMALEIGGGLLFGSIALVADGLRMSTHAGALLLAALVYSFASRHATDTRFTFDMGKLCDPAGFASAIVLAMIALLIGCEAVFRLFAPVVIDLREAIPNAFFGLGIDIASVCCRAAGMDITMAWSKPRSRA